MGIITSKNLFTLISTEIDKNSQYLAIDRFGQQLLRPSDIAPFAISSNTNVDISAQELIRAVQNVLIDALPQRIISGLTVVAEDPISDKVVISAGAGTVGGNVYELEEDTTIQIPFDNESRIYYVILYRDTIMLERTSDSRKLTLAKIIIPEPGITDKIRNNDNQTFDAYIMQYQEYKLFGDANGKFEEDTKELLKNNIGDILAETIVGTITLSENLKITNTNGTLDMDSTSIKMKNLSGQILVKLNKDGIFFNSDTGIELAKFATSGARIGNIVINPSNLQSGNFISGLQGFRIQDSGDTEFNAVTVRGRIIASTGVIGGFTILSDRMYGGKIMTDYNVAAGATGVVMDSAGLRGYDSVLGLVFNLPTNGSVPTFSSGIIASSVFEINTNAVMRTSSTVGDGSSLSYGILINNTGIYACQANQTISNANLKALITGTISITGQINATSGQIGNVNISSTGLSGGLISGSTIRGAIIETADSAPRIRMDSTALYFQTTTNVGKYGSSASGSFGFQYGDGTKYGAGVTAYLFHNSYPVLTVFSERNVADLRLYNRTADPTAGTHVVGDLIVTQGKLKICITAGSPGTFQVVGVQTA